MALQVLRIDTRIYLIFSSPRYATNYIDIYQYNIMNDPEQYGIMKVTDKLSNGIFTAEIFGLRDHRNIVIILKYSYAIHL